MNHRLAANTNLTLHTQSTYNNKPVMQLAGGLIFNCLDRLERTIEKSLNEHPRTFAVRFDLRFPDNYPYEMMHGSVSRFIDALKYRIGAVNNRITPSGRKPHRSSVRYVWAMEQETSTSPHYHFLLLLNGDSFSAVGNYETDSDNTYSRIVSAWNSALKVPDCIGLVHFAENGVYHINRNESYDNLFHRSSYLCKVYTKRFSNELDSFGYSKK